MTATVLLLAVLAQTAHQHHPPRSADEYARVLETPERAAWQQPELVLKELKLRSDEVIADLGAGTGYFSRRFAPHVGKVYAVDIDPKLLEIAGKDAPPNLVTIAASPDDPKLPPSGVDTIFICNVLHHIHGRPAYYAKLATALKPGGRIVNIDFFKKKLPVGPPASMKLSEEEVIAELQAAGFVLARRESGLLPYQYWLEFKRDR